MTLSLKPLPMPTFSKPEQADELRDQDVHIHCLDIRGFTPDHQVDAERMMSSAERERAQKFIRGREMYIASRWLLRKVLATYLDVAPTAVEFLRSAKGKPYLPQGGFYFSLSHSGNWALLAVARAEFIGVDIEAANNTRDFMNIAESYYHAREFVQLQRLAATEQNDYFYRLWTLKEAFFKALGTGITAGLEKIAFELAADEISAEIAPELKEECNQWQYQQWTLGAQDYCALACKSQYPLQTHWFDALAAPAFP